MTKQSYIYLLNSWGKKQRIWTPVQRHTDQFPRDQHKHYTVGEDALTNQASPLGLYSPGGNRSQDVYDLMRIRRNEKYVLSYLVSGQGPASSLNCPVIDILQFPATENALQLLSLG